MMKKVFRMLESTENICVFIAVLLLVFSVLSVCAEVVARALFNTSYVWVNEFNEYILLYIPFLVAGWLLRHKEHISIDIIENKISYKATKILDIFIAFIGVFVCVIFVLYGVAATYDYFIGNIRSYTILRFPKVYVIGIIPFGSFLLLLEFIRMLIQSIEALKNS